MGDRAVRGPCFQLGSARSKTVPYPGLLLFLSLLKGSDPTVNRLRKKRASLRGNLRPDIRSALRQGCPLRNAISCTRLPLRNPRLGSRNLNAPQGKQETERN